MVQHRMSDGAAQMLIQGVSGSGKNGMTVSFDDLAGHWLRATD